jgi:hypothetical protein
MPRTIRVDNGQPFAVPERSSIPVLSLWLIGMGIAVHFNKRYAPQQNAKVERNQGTTGKWSDYKKCKSYQQLQEALDQACLIQREKYPLDRQGFKTRKELFPDLYMNPNRYLPENFSLMNVLKTVAQGTYIRRISKSNQFTFYGLQPTIPKGYACQDIALQLDINQNCWLVYDKIGNQITELKNDFITYDNIINLTIRRSPGKS